MEPHDENPFRSPDLLEEDGRLTFNQQQERSLRIGEAIVYWERLRIVYNALLVAVSLGVLLLTFGLGSLSNWIELVLGALLANLCFCAGPIVSAYMAWFNIRSRGFDLLMFGAGTTLSVIWAFLAIRF